MFATAEKTKNQVLPDVLSGYLDLLLQDATECVEVVPVEVSSPELVEALPASLETLVDVEDTAVPYIRIRAGQFYLLVPLNRVSRVERVSLANRANTVKVPECPTNGEFVLLGEVGDPGIAFDGFEGIEYVAPSAILWRFDADRSPWYTGTHKSILCRVFDPVVYFRACLSPSRTCGHGLLDYI